MNLCYSRAEEAVLTGSLDRESIQQRDPYVFLAIPSLALLSVLVGSKPGCPYTIQSHHHDRHGSGALERFTFTTDSWPVVARGLDAIARELNAATAGVWRHDDLFVKQLARLCVEDPDADSPAEASGRKQRRGRRR